MYNVKLNCSMAFSNNEGDLIDYMDKLKSQHKLGTVMSQCMRVCWDHREELQKIGIDPFDGDNSISETRYKYFKKISSQLDEMREKVDKLYDMAYKNYMLAQFGKKLGLEEKAEMSLAAEYIIKRQIDDLSKALGVSNLTQVWKSNKKEDFDARADEILEYIINSYDGIVKEIVQASEATVISKSGAVDNTDKEEYVKGEKIDKGITSNKSDTDNSVDLNAISKFLNIGV